MVAQLKNSERYIKKHHAAIHCSTNLTLLQRKIGNCLLFKAYHNLLTQDFHDITIQELMVLLEIRTKDYQKLKDGICKLMSTVIEWNVLKNNSVNIVKPGLNDENWRACTLLASVQIDGSLIKYEYSRTLCEQLYRPSNYTQIKLSVQNKFKSTYALILYENSLRYINVGTTGWITIELFRKIMGVEDSQYTVFRDFNRRVLKVAVLEVNKYSDVFVDFEVKKIKRNPVSIRFFVKKSFVMLDEEEPWQKNVGTSDFEKENLAIVDRLEQYGIPKVTSLDWLEKYEKPYILEKIKLVENSLKGIKNIGGFLSSALKNNFMRPVEKLMICQESHKESIDLEKLKNQEQLVRINYQNYIDEKFRQWILNLSDNDRLNLRTELKYYLEKEGKLIPLSKTAKKQINHDEMFENRSVFQILKIFVNQFNEGGVVKGIWKFPTLMSFNEFTGM